jgi:hypothetical protein
MRKHFTIIVAICIIVGPCIYLCTKWTVEPVSPTAAIYSNDLLSRRLARFEPEAGMTQADVKMCLGEPQAIDGQVWRYFPFEVGGDRYRLTLVFDAAGLASWEWAWP